MIRRYLPPMVAGQVYRSPVPAKFDFNPAPMELSLTAGNTATLRLKLVNETTSEVQAADHDLQLLMRWLIDAVPSAAVHHVAQRHHSIAGSPR